MSSSRLQRKTAHLLSYNFYRHEIKENNRPIWCLGEKGERLELDFMIESLKVAIEVQGAQHYVYTPYFHKSPYEFSEQVRRDRDKKQRCEEYGFILFEVDDEPSLVAAIDSIVEIEKHIHMLNKNPLEQKTVKQWLQTFGDLHNNVDKAWRHWHTWREKSFIIGIRTGDKLKALMDNYGVGVFSIADEVLMQEIFWAVQKLRNKSNDLRHKAKAQRRKIGGA